MKLASLLAGAAVLALSATGVSAQSVNVFTTGQSSATGSTYFNGGGFFENIAAAANGLNALNGDSLVSSWQALGSSVGNAGAAATSDGATFTLRGFVTPDCSFYSGSSQNQTIDFGTIGIHASDASPALAFTMVAPASVTIATNLAGCNTANTVTVSKSDVNGLVNLNPSGYDTNAFQAHLPYTVDATYTAGGLHDQLPAGSTTLSVGATTQSNSADHGAWKSPMLLAVTIPQPSRGLLAGLYTGELGVNISVY